MVLASKTWQDETKSATTNPANATLTTATNTTPNTSPPTAAAAAVVTSSAAAAPTLAAASVGVNSATATASSVTVTGSEISLSLVSTGPGVGVDIGAGLVAADEAVSGDLLDDRHTAVSSVFDNANIERTTASLSWRDLGKPDDGHQLCYNNNSQTLTVNATPKPIRIETQSTNENENVWDTTVTAAAVPTTTDIESGDELSDNANINANANYINDGATATATSTPITTAYPLGGAGHQYTLQPPIVRKFRAPPIPPPAPHQSASTNPITADDLNCALKRVMNAEAVNSVSGGSSNINNNNNAKNKLQNNFLNSLGLSGVAGVPVVVDGPDMLSNGAGGGGSGIAGGNIVIGGGPGGGSIRVGNQLNAAFCSASEDSDDPFDASGPAKIMLLCEANSHPFQTRSIQLTPNVECKVGRLIARSKACESNAIFDCKVLSRNHAVLWYTNEDRKFWVKDTKSSNGTFINDAKLGNDPAELHFGDIVKFGVDVLENSRKEVHGCIIACVKLFYPDGREAITLSAAAKGQVAGECKISYEEMHRINLHMQEAAQREKVLKSKLYNIQNVLDATRKNSSLCWQSLVAEDQLLNRIHALEKKLQIMEKNTPESALRNEVLKLLDDKSTCQLTAKEALRKVYQERCDAMQMLSKMETAFNTSENECKMWREQLHSTKQSLQDVNARLVQLEADYTSYREDAMHNYEEAQLLAEKRLEEIKEKLRVKDRECEYLRQKLEEIEMSRPMRENDENDEKQAFAKLDAAIAMGFEDDDDDDDDDEDNDDDEDDDIVEDHIRSVKATTDVRDHLEVEATANQKATTNGLEHLNISGKKRLPKKSKQMIQQWLQNSDLNKNENVIKAICNEMDSGDEQPDGENASNGGRAGNANSSQSTNDSFETKYSRFANIMEMVQRNLKRLETEIIDVWIGDGDGNVAAAAKATADDDSGDDEADADGDGEGERERGATKKKNGESLQRKGNCSSYYQLKSSVDALNEVYNEFYGNRRRIGGKDSPRAKSPPVTSALKSSLDRSPREDVGVPIAAGAAPVDLESDNDESASQASTTPDSNASTLYARGQGKDSPRDQHHLEVEQQMREYQQQIRQLREKFEQLEADSQNTLEIMQIECDDYKGKVAQLQKTVQALSEENQALQQVMDQNKSNVAKSAEYAAECPSVVEEKKEESDKKENKLAEELLLQGDNENDTANANIASVADEDEMRHEIIAINSDVVQREEELITYKERLEQTQNDNLQLRREIEQLKCKKLTPQSILQCVLPLGIAVIAFIIYIFKMNYF